MRPSGWGGRQEGGSDMLEPEQLVRVCAESRVELPLAVADLWHRYLAFPDPVDCARRIEQIQMRTTAQQRSKRSQNPEVWIGEDRSAGENYLLQQDGRSVVSNGGVQDLLDGTEGLELEAESWFGIRMDWLESNRDNCPESLQETREALIRWGHTPDLLTFVGYHQFRIAKEPAEPGLQLFPTRSGMFIVNCHEFFLELTRREDLRELLDSWWAMEGTDLDRVMRQLEPRRLQHVDHFAVQREIRAEKHRQLDSA